MSTSVSMLLLLCALSLSLLVQAKGGVSNKYISACLTPNQEAGQCIALRKCPTLHAVVLNETRDAAAVRFLQQSECGVVGRFRIFCCANEYHSAAPWDAAAPHHLITSGPSEEVTQSTPGFYVANRKDTPTTLSPLFHPHRSLLPTGTCGRQDVFNSSALPKIGEQPWNVLLQYENAEGEASLACGGVLISKRYVLTAAHCTTTGNTHGLILVSVRVGEHNLATETDCEESEDGDEEFCGESAVDLAIEREIPHPGFTTGGTTTAHDIALLRLEPHVLSTQEVTPICLPISAQQLGDVMQGVYVAGWGVSNDIPTSTVKLSSPATLMQPTSCGLLEPRDVSTRLCVMVASCAADDGGPLVSRANDERYYVAGVASHGTAACGVKQAPIVYTRVAQYSSWILDQLRP